MMSREFLKQIGVFGVILGLTASPLVFADEKEHQDGDYSQSDKTTMEDDNATGGAAGEAQQGDTDWEEQKDQEDDVQGAGNGDGAEVAVDPSDAGAAGIKGQEGTQSGEEPDPEDENDTQTQ